MEEQRPEKAAALDVTEAIILALIESGAVAPDAVLIALEDTVERHALLAARPGTSARERQMHNTVAETVRKLICGTNLYAAAQCDGSDSSSRH